MHGGLIHPFRRSGSSNVTQIDKADEKEDSKGDGHITFAQDVKLPHPSAGSTLHVPPPKERDQGMQLVFLLDVPRRPIDRVPGVPITETDNIPSDDGMLSNRNRMMLAFAHLSDVFSNFRRGRHQTHRV